MDKEARRSTTRNVSGEPRATGAEEVKESRSFASCACAGVHAAGRCLVADPLAWQGSTGEIGDYSTEEVAADLPLDDAPRDARAPVKPLLEKIYSYRDPEQVKALGVYPYFRPLESAQAPEVVVGGDKLIMMGSNNYLGLVNDERVIRAAREAARKYGSGCAGSRLLNGTLDIHEELERRLATFVGKEAALLYSTGFQSNLGAISTLVSRRDYVVIDKRNHASIVDGVLLSRANTLRYRHNDLDHLAKLLAGIEPGSKILVIVDGVFSMEGDIAPLPEIIRLCDEYGAAFMVDDAHGLGVLGDGGGGTATYFGLVDGVDLIMGTFSKSLASIGGFIAADREIIEYLKHNSRAMIFSASMPPASVASVLCALDIIEKEPERIEQLWRNTRVLRTGLLKAGFDLGESCTPIMPIMLGDDMTVFRMCARLHQEGVFVNPVPGLSRDSGHALIRVSVMATHEISHLERALEKFIKVGRELGVIQS